MLSNPNGDASANKGFVRATRKVYVKATIEGSCGQNAIRDHLKNLNNLLQALLALTETEVEEGAEIEILKKKLLTVYAGLQGTNQIALLMAMTQDADCSEDCFVPKVQGALAALAFEFSDDLNKYS